MSYNLTPLAVCERLIGPKQKLAQISGLGEKAPYTWERESKWRPAGCLPVPVQRKVLTYARRHAIPLDPAWLIEGAPIEDVYRALDQMKAAAA